MLDVLVLGDTLHRDAIDAMAISDTDGVAYIDGLLVANLGGSAS